MREELQRMKSVDRPASSRAIAEAREKGDLKENAEYDAAKEAQGMLEAKIKQLEGMIANAKIVDTSTIDTSKVTILIKIITFDIHTQEARYRNYRARIVIYTLSINGSSYVVFTFCISIIS